MKQTYAVVISTLCCLALTAGVAFAEGDPPATVPTTKEALASIGETNVPEPNDSLDSSSLDSGEPIIEEKPAPESWRPIVDNLQPGYLEASNLPVQGLAMYYNPGVFKRVLKFRHDNEHISACDECVGYVALLRAGDIDRRVWLQRKDHIAEGPFWVVDVAARRDIPGLLSRGWVVDVDHNTAMRWRMAGPIPITVYAAESRIAREFAGAYFSSEMIPLNERHIIPPRASSFREPGSLGQSENALYIPHPGTEHTESDSLQVYLGNQSAEAFLRETIRRYREYSFD